MDFVLKNEQGNKNIFDFVPSSERKEFVARGKNETIALITPKIFEMILKEIGLKVRSSPLSVHF